VTGREPVGLIRPQDDELGAALDVGAEHSDDGHRQVVAGDLEGVADVDAPPGDRGTDRHLVVASGHTALHDRVRAVPDRPVEVVGEGVDVGVPDAGAEDDPADRALHDVGPGRQVRADLVGRPRRVGLVRHDDRLPGRRIGVDRAARDAVDGGIGRAQPEGQCLGGAEFVGPEQRVAADHGQHRQSHHEQHGRRPARSRPSTNTWPDVGVSRPPARCNSVDLPDPDGPITATSSPA